MQSSLTDHLSAIGQKGLVLLLSCIDDAIVISLSKLGISLPGLQFLSTCLLIMTLSFWLYRILRFLIRRYGCQGSAPIFLSQRTH